MEESQVLRNLGAKLRQLEKEKQEERKKHEEERRKYLKQLKKAGISIELSDDAESDDTEDVVSINQDAEDVTSTDLNTRPILESRSISSVARSKAKKDILIKLPIYDHWFAWPSFH